MDCLTGGLIMFQEKTMSRLNNNEFLLLSHNLFFPRIKNKSVSLQERGLKRREQGRIRKTFSFVFSSQIPVSRLKLCYISHGSRILVWVVFLLVCSFSHGFQLLLLDPLFQFMQDFNSVLCNTTFSFLQRGILATWLTL